MAVLQCVPEPFASLLAARLLALADPPAADPPTRALTPQEAANCLWALASLLRVHAGLIDALAAGLAQSLAEAAAGGVGVGVGVGGEGEGEGGDDQPGSRAGASAASAKRGPTQVWSGVVRVCVVRV